MAKLKAKTHKINWHAFFGGSSEAGALMDFCKGKSLNAISQYIYSPEAKTELAKAKKIKVKSARIGAKRVAGKYYELDYDILDYYY